MLDIVAPVYRDDPRLQPLIGPGGPFEVEAVVVHGVPLRDFVRAPRTIVDVFAMGDAHADLVHARGAPRSRSLPCAGAADHVSRTARGSGRDCDA
jgi:hypothetical protein